MKYELYQIQSDVCPYHFMSYEWFKEHQSKINPSDYEKVYSGEYEATKDAEGKPVNEPVGKILENIFDKFNIDKPKDFHGYSLSVSDLVVLISENGRQCWYTNTIGFARLDRKDIAGQEA